MFLFTKPSTMVTAAEALPGRDETMPVPARHDVLGTPLAPPFPDGLEQAVFGMGCFWGAERKFWQAPGVYTTAVGYAGGFTPNPTYEEVCSGRTGHTEAVLVVFDPKQTSYDEMLRALLGEPRPDPGHAPGQRRGTQYRSAIYTANDAQRAAAEASRDDVPGASSHAPATARSRPRSPTPGRSTTPRTTTSSTSRRTRTATAGSAARASPVPSVSSPRSRDREAPLHGRSSVVERVARGQHAPLREAEPLPWFAPVSRVRAAVTVVLFLAGGVFFAFPVWALLLFPAAALAAQCLRRPMLRAGRCGA